MLLLYPLFYQFYHCKIFLQKWIFYGIWIKIFVIYFLMFFLFSIWLIKQFESSFIFTIAITCEQVCYFFVFTCFKVRLIMKMWAFIRENINYAIQNHQNTLNNIKSYFIFTLYFF